jgi:hypothetical protein
LLIYRRDAVQLLLYTHILLTRLCCKASHVALSVSKLLSRMGERSVDALGMCTDKTKYFDSSYGIASDPLTQFACVFAALIHDVRAETPTGLLMRRLSHHG